MSLTVQPKPTQIGFQLTENDTFPCKERKPSLPPLPHTNSSSLGATEPSQVILKNIKNACTDVSQKFFLDMNCSDGKFSEQKE